VLPANAGPWRLRALGGGLEVRAESGAPNAHKLPRLACSVDVLESLVSGALSPARAVETGLLESTNSAAERVEPWFRARAVFLMPMNAF